MNSKEYFEKHKELSEKLNLVKKQMKKFEKDCSVKKVVSGKIIPNESKNCNEWNRLLKQEIEIIKELQKLSADYDNQK